MPDDALILDLDDLTIGDLETLEKVSGRTYTKVLSGLDADELDAATMKAIILISLRKVNPDATEADAAKVKIASIKSGDEADPTETSAAT